MMVADPFSGSVKELFLQKRTNERFCSVSALDTAG